MPFAFRADKQLNNFVLSVNVLSVFARISKSVFSSGITANCSYISPSLSCTINILSAVPPSAVFVFFDASIHLLDSFSSIGSKLYRL
jgi:hypothetical protein